MRRNKYTLRAVTFIVGCFGYSTSLFADKSDQKIPVTRARMEFVLQENLEPWELAPCEHEEESTGVDWLVTCKLGQTKHVYRVHLVIHQYGKTRFGQSAYEILYWVTDSTQARQPAHTSSTIWIHNRQAAVDVALIELAQGVENDLKALRLKVFL